MGVLELTAIIITGVLSCCDLAVNIWSVCMEGECLVKFGSSSFEHKDRVSSVAHELSERRSSVVSKSVGFEDLDTQQIETFEEVSESVEV